MLIASASMRGRKPCRLRCSGQTSAMMNSANATGAKTELATDNAATTRMIAIRTCAP